MVLVHLPKDTSSSSALPSSVKDFSYAYHHILKSARRHYALSSAAASAVLVLVATDVDATCAARALSRLLSEDEIMYRIAPVDGFRTLQRILQEDVLGNEDVSSATAVFASADPISCFAHFASHPPSSPAVLFFDSYIH